MSKLTKPELAENGVIESVAVQALAYLAALERPMVLIHRVYHNFDRTWAAHADSAVSVYEGEPHKYVISEKPELLRLGSVDSIKIGSLSRLEIVLHDNSGNSPKYSFGFSNRSKVLARIETCEMIRHNQAIHFILAKDLTYYRTLVELLNRSTKAIESNE